MNLPKQDPTSNRKRTPDTAPACQAFFISSRHIQTALVIAPPPGDDPQAKVECRASFFDSDGAKCNQVTVRFPAVSVSVLEVEPFIESCKLESGVRHGRVAVEIPAGCGFSLRYQTTDGAVISEAPLRLSSERSAFFPVVLDPERMVCVALMNQDTAPAEVRCRLFLGKRSPEINWMIPGEGSRLLNIAEEFGSQFDHEIPVSSRGYLRLMTRSVKGLGLQMIERMPGAQGGDRIQVVR